VRTIENEHIFANIIFESLQVLLTLRLSLSSKPLGFGDLLSLAVDSQIYFINLRMTKSIYNVNSGLKGRGTRHS
jgi:hypothetical protein